MLREQITVEMDAVEAELSALHERRGVLREMAALAARLDGAAPESPKAPASSHRRTRERSAPKRETRRTAAQDSGASAGELRARVLELVQEAGAEGVTQADVARRVGVTTERVRRASADLQRNGSTAIRGARPGQGGGRPSAVMVAVSNGRQPAAAPAPKAPPTLDGRVIASLIAPKYGAEVANELGVSIAELSPVLERLKDEGEVRRCEGGKWEAVR